jgi:solute carrier family 25 (mitochondrial phosphate transporter), member 23/24/25/41
MPFSGKVHKPQLSPLELEDAEARKQRIRALYDKIDVDNSGHLDTSDLERRFRELRNAAGNPLSTQQLPLGSTQMYAKELLKKCDSNANGTISYSEFEAFVQAKEKELWELFKQIDTGKDNLIGADELQSSLKKAGRLMIYTDYSCLN